MRFCQTIRRIEMNDVIEMIDTRLPKRLRMQNCACYAMCIYVITEKNVFDEIENGSTTKKTNKIYNNGIVSVN